MKLLELLADSSLIMWVAESDYGYPVILTLHSLGMALVIGVLSVMNLRVLGVAKVLPVNAIKPFFVFAWGGLFINFLSGLLLFIANYSAFLTNTAFITKICLLVFGGLFTYFLSQELNFSEVSENPENDISNRSKVLALLSLLAWCGAITAGRIVGYTSIPV